MEILFLDFQQAFDTIKGYCLVKVLTELKVPAELVRLVQMMMKNTEVLRTTVRETVDSAKNHEVRQKDFLYATFFNSILDMLLEK